MDPRPSLPAVVAFSVFTGGALLFVAALALPPPVGVVHAGGSEVPRDTSEASGEALLGHPAARRATLARRLERGCPAERAAAAVALAGADASPSTVASLVRALEDDDPEVRAAARWGIRRIGEGPSGAVDALLRRAACADEAEAADALRTLGSIAGGRTGVLDGLTKALCDAAPVRARGAAAGLVLAGPEGVGRLVDALEADPDAADALRGVTVRAVSVAEEERLAGTCAASLLDRHRELRTLLLRSLAAATPRAASAVPALVRRLSGRDGDEEERRLAVEALAAVGASDPEAQAALRSVLEDSESGVRAAAARALAGSR